MGTKSVPENISYKWQYCIYYVCLNRGLNVWGVAATPSVFTRCDPLRIVSEEWIVCVEDAF